MRFPNAFRQAETAFVIAAFVVFNGAATFLFVQDEQLTEAARESLRLLFLPIYATTVLLILPRRWLILRTAIANWHLAVLFLAAWLSILWSIDPDVSLRRCVGLLFTNLFCIYLCGRYSLATVLKLYAATSGGIILLSYAFVLLFPSQGLQGEASSMLPGWRGIFTQKNSLGGFLLVAIVVFAFVDANAPWQRALRWTGLVLAVIMLWFCTSRTPLVNLVALIPLALLIRSCQHRLMTSVVLSLTVVTMTYVGGAIALLHTTDILELLGKDITISGRTELWILAQKAIMNRPWLGYGYGAFWETEMGPSRAIWELIRWEAPSAHNGYMDLWLSLGVLGPLFISITFLINFKNAIIAQRNGRAFEGRWCLVFTFVMILSSVNESVFMDPNSMLWILFLVATIYAQRAAQGCRHEHPQRYQAQGAIKAMPAYGARIDMPLQIVPAGLHEQSRY